MPTFDEVVDAIEHLSEDERDELWKILRCKKQEDILKASELAIKESEEGKTIVVSSPEEIKSFFENLMNED